MKNKLIDYFLRFTNLSTEEIVALKESMEIKSFSKNSFLVKEGQVNNETFYILNGGVREYKIMEDDEVTTNFYTEGQWIISLTKFTKDTISSRYLQSIEDTTVVVGNEQKAEELFKQFPRFEKVSRQVMETVFSEQQQFMASYLTDTPEKRYLKLLQTSPELFQKVPQYQIASYIGVKPESLSRIRNRIGKKQ